MQVREAKCLMNRPDSLKQLLPDLGRWRPHSRAAFGKFEGL